MNVYVHNDNLPGSNTKMKITDDRKRHPSLAMENDLFGISSKVHFCFRSKSQLQDIIKELQFMHDECDFLT